MDMVRFSLDLVVEKGYSNWSLENVSTPQMRALLDEYCERYPDKMAYTTLDAADYGVPQNRVRLIAANPATIRLMRQQPVRRVTVSDAFAAAGFALPATHIKSNTSNRDGSPCIRSVQQQAHTVTASHPHTWCRQDGTTVRCLTPAECALLQGFPGNWRLPTGSRLGIRPCQPPYPSPRRPNPPTQPREGRPHCQRCQVQVAETARRAFEDCRLQHTACLETSPKAEPNPRCRLASSLWRGHCSRNRRLGLDHAISA